MLIRRITYRLYPTKTEQEKLHWARRMHCALYNAAVANRKTQYQKFGHSVDYFEQQNSLPAFKAVWPEYKGLGGHALQATLKRVDLGFQRFFKGLSKYPKFKASRHYRGWTYPDRQSWSVTTSNGVNGHLELRDLDISLQMRGKARTWGNLSTCTIVYVASEDKWYASITVQCTPVRQAGSGAIGIDLGCKEAVSFSNGEHISKPDFLKAGESKVKVASKQLRRKRAPNHDKKIKASRRWKKARKQVSKLQRQVARQRENWLHKLTSNIVRYNSLVAGEKLNVKAMTSKARQGKRKKQKSGLNRSILEVGFGLIGQFLTYKEVEAGGFYLESPTQHLKPTQRCTKCWELTPKALADRIHICSNPSCGHRENRDINAAQVNLAWALGQELVPLVAESPTSTSCGSMKQVGAMRRQKLLAQRSGLE